MQLASDDRIVEAERLKYVEMWAVPAYRAHSPGLENVERFVSVVDPDCDETVIDVGCGAGVAGLELARRGFDVHWLDLTDAGLDPEVPRDRFICDVAWGRWSAQRRMGWDYGFCCDVMEHLPTEYVMLTIDRIMSACRVAWFQIALRPDEFGKVIGKPLHLTVQTFEWWRDRIAGVADLVEARDLCGDGLYLVAR